MSEPTPAPDEQPLSADDLAATDDANQAVTHSLKEAFPLIELPSAELIQDEGNLPSETSPLPGDAV